MASLHDTCSALKRSTRLHKKGLRCAQCSILAAQEQQQQRLPLRVRIQGLPKHERHKRKLQLPKQAFRAAVVVLGCHLQLVAVDVQVEIHAT